MKVELEITEEVVENIVLRELMLAYELCSQPDYIDCSNDRIEPDQELMDALDKVIRYYSSDKEYQQWKKVKKTPKDVIEEHGESIWHPYTLDEVLDGIDLNEPLPEEVPCKTHPDAPHGFNRNASHEEGRYVCDCEHWEPETTIVDKTKECCEGGPMTAGCYHDHCTGPKERE